MLCALAAMYQLTESVIGTAVVTITLGVRQGSPTSCLLFIIFVNDLMKIIKEGCEVDGFLGWLHILVLMDHTVLLSTSRDGMRKKIRLLQNYSTDYGMKINHLKTNFFVISGRERDREPLVVDGLSVEWCNSYLYLGSPFTSDGCVSSAAKEHAKRKMCHALKYVSFVNNSDIPF